MNTTRLQQAHALLEAEYETKGPRLPPSYETKDCPAARPHSITKKSTAPVHYRAPAPASTVEHVSPRRWADIQRKARTQQLLRDVGKLLGR